MTDWRTNSHHVFISGATGAGKTTLAHEIYCNSHRVGVFFNPQYEQIRGKEVHSAIEMLDEMRKGNELLNYIPSDVTSEGLEDEHDTIVQILFHLSKQSKTEFLLISDEAHELGDSLERAVKRGRRWGVKVLVLSQEARNVSHSVLTQVKNHVWVGKPGRFEKSYFKRYGLDYTALADQPEHGYTVMEQSGEVIEERPSGADVAYST